jgi:hypothetical protein
MPPRKSLDIDPEISALLAKAEKLKTDQKLLLGELVLDTGVHKVLDADQIKDALIRARDQAKTSLSREGKPADAGGTFSAKPNANAKPNGHAEPEPTLHRPADLLSGTASGRADPRPAAEGPGLERAS